MRILIDVTGVGLVVLNMVLGFRYGLLRRLLMVAGLYVAVAVASVTGNSLESWFYGTGKTDALYAAALSFIAVLAAVVVAIEILGALYSDRLRAITTLIFDRSVAVGVGALLGLAEIALVCVVGLSIGNVHPAADGSLALPGDRGSVGDAVRASVIGGRVNASAPFMQNLFKPVLPGDLAGHFGDATRMGTATRAQP